MTPARRLWRAAMSVAAVTAILAAGCDRQLLKIAGDSRSIREIESEQERLGTRLVQLRDDYRKACDAGKPIYETERIRDKIRDVEEQMDHNDAVLVAWRGDSIHRNSAAQATAASSRVRPPTATPPTGGCRPGCP